MSFSADLRPIIFGCTGPMLDDDECAFFQDAKPAGIILFQKNCIDPAQVTKLCDDLRDCVNWEIPILIDQEGGRVQRLKAPGWPGTFPAMRPFGEVFKANENAALGAVENNYKALAEAQKPLGIDVNCVPVLDVVPDANKVRAIDDRSFGSDPDAVAELGLAALRASIAAGVTPVMKHIPGHGRAVVDSHHELPRVDADYETLAAEWMPFQKVAANVDQNKYWAMTCHVIYEAIDPDLPATLSPIVIRDIIRGKIGFEGLLLTDDLFMDALAPFGNPAACARLSVAAGCDLALYCHGNLLERERAAEAVGPMRADTRMRLDNWFKNRI